MQYNPLNSLRRECRHFAVLLLVSAIVTCWPSRLLAGPSGPVSVVSSYCSFSEFDNYPVIALKQANYSHQNSDVAVEFVVDVLSDTRPDILVEFIHCDPSWQPTNNIFVQSHSQVLYLDTWTRLNNAMNSTVWEGVVSLPNPHVSFDYSGNYLCIVRPTDSPDSTLHSFKLFVSNESVSVDIYSSQRMRSINNSRKVDIDLTVNKNGVFVPTAAVVYARGQYDRGFGVSDRILNSMTNEVEFASRFSLYGRNMPYSTFSFREIPVLPTPRRLDITNTVHFPSRGIGYLRRPDTPRDDADVVFERGPWVFTEKSLGSPISEFVLLEIELQSEELEGELLVAGTFNNWSPTFQDRLVFDPIDKMYVLQRWVKRGIHGYAYVLRTSTDTNKSLEVFSPAFVSTKYSSAPPFIACTYTYTREYGGFYELVSVVFE